MDGIHVIQDNVVAWSRGLCSSFGVPFKPDRFTFSSRSHFTAPCILIAATFALDPAILGTA